MGAMSGPPSKLASGTGFPGRSERWGVWGPCRGPHLSWGPCRGPHVMNLIGEVGRQPRTLGDGQHHLARLTLAHDGDLHALPDAQHLHETDEIRNAADRG